jgi:riboflavin kinase/FMN adenylyltransferase
MKLFTRLEDWTGGPPATLCLGQFDGMHLAHTALIRRAVGIARVKGGAAVVHSFSRHPLEVLMPERAPLRLMPPTARVRAIAALGPGALVMRAFDTALAQTSAEDFVAELAARLRPSDVVVGFNHSFGAGGVGTPELLARLGRTMGFAVHVLPALRWQGGAVSSSRIRAALAEGDVKAARAMLGRPFALYGRLGAEGWLDAEPGCLLPGPGIYEGTLGGQGVRVLVGDGVRLLGGVETPGFARVELLERAWSLAPSYQNKL